MKIQMRKIPKLKKEKRGKKKGKEKGKVKRRIKWDLRIQRNYAKGGTN